MGKNTGAKIGITGIVIFIIISALLSLGLTGVIIWAIIALVQHLT
jgi:hypothetical protein